MRNLALMAVLLLVCCGCTSNENRSADRAIRTLVDDTIEAHGGQDALRQIDGYIAFGKLHAVRRNTLIRTTRWFQREDHLLLELDYPGSPEWRLTKGKQSWKGSSPGNLAPATGPVIWSMRLQTARFDLPIRLLDYETELTLLPPDDLGRPVLSHDLGDGLRMDYHIDTDTHLVAKITMNMVGPPAMAFEADYGGYRQVAGVMLPHREVTRAGGTVTSKVVIDSFVVNPPNLADKLAMPWRL